MTDNQLSQLVTRAIAITRHGKAAPSNEGPMMAVVLQHLIIRTENPDYTPTGGEQ